MPSGYMGTLKVDGKKQAEVICANKEIAAQMICYYLAQYINEGSNFSVTIKYKDVEAQHGILRHRRNRRSEEGSPVSQPGAQ